jgi:hypothetical protein
MSETRVLIRLLRIYFPRISEFGPRYATDGVYMALLLRLPLREYWEGWGTTIEDTEFDDVVTTSLYWNLATQCCLEHMHLQTALQRTHIQNSS